MKLRVARLRKLNSFHSALRRGIARKGSTKGRKGAGKTLKRLTRAIGRIKRRLKSHRITLELSIKALAKMDKTKGHKPRFVKFKEIKWFIRLLLQCCDNRSGRGLSHVWDTRQDYRLAVVRYGGKHFNAPAQPLSQSLRKGDINLPVLDQPQELKALGPLSSEEIRVLEQVEPSQREAALKFFRATAPERELPTEVGSHSTYVESESEVSSLDFSSEEETSNPYGW